MTKASILYFYTVSFLPLVMDPISALPSRNRETLTPIGLFPAILVPATQFEQSNPFDRAVVAILHPLITRTSCGSNQLLPICSLWRRYVNEGFSQESAFEILGAQVTQDNRSAIPPGNHIQGLPRRSR